MIIIITGSSHTGKTNLAQKLLEEYKMPYLSVDHLKMGLIRSGNTALTPEDDDELAPYLWKIVREIIKTAVENNQNLIIEGCYIPFDWQKDFSGEYLAHIRFFCLVMTDNYIERHFDDIKKYASVIERRLDDSFCTKDMMLTENRKNLALCRQFDCEYLLIDDKYQPMNAIKEMIRKDKKHEKNRAM